MSNLSNYIKNNEQEKWLIFLASLALSMYICSVLKFPLWDILQGTPLGNFLINSDLASLLSGISGSVFAAYIFHFFSSIIPMSKGSYIAEMKLKDAYSATLSNICLHHLTFEQGQIFQLPSGQTVYTDRALSIAKESINLPQVFNGERVINHDLSNEQLDIHLGLVERHDYIMSMMKVRSNQFGNLEVYYRYFDAKTIDEIERIKQSLDCSSYSLLRNGNDSSQKKHATIIGYQRGIIKLLEKRKTR